jgi:hypothetical protein
VLRRGFGKSTGGGQLRDGLYACRSHQQTGQVGYVAWFCLIKAVVRSNRSTNQQVPNSKSSQNASSSRNKRFQTQMVRATYTLERLYGHGRRRAVRTSFATPGHNGRTGDTRANFMLQILVEQTPLEGRYTSISPGLQLGQKKDLTLYQTVLVSHSLLDNRLDNMLLESITCSNP